MGRFVSLKKYFFISVLSFIPSSFSFALNVANCELVGAYVGACSNVPQIERLSKKGINAIVIDVKNDEGKIFLDLLNNGGEKISKFVKELKEKNFYTIARIVAFKDKKKVSENKSWAIYNEDGSLYVDKEKMSWLNPYNEEVQEYLINLGKLAIQFGFDEVQYDYIRFSAYKTVDSTQVSKNFAIKSRVEIINEFLEKATNEIHRGGGKISADVFGCIIPNLFHGWENNSEVLGQNYEQMSNIVDFICPMIYPSHFPSDFVSMREVIMKNGKIKQVRFSAPDLSPYEIIKESLLASKKSEIANVKVRPWLQCFSAVWLKPGKWKKYSSADVQKQIEATTEQEIFQCCLWNSTGNYTILG
ncbi:MAG: putative glycoside hydrolase [Cytophagales bacterium]|jgi:hypothetical protein|nr:putative glycoside hydrolase [Cytophagales bacterium]